MGNDHSYSTQCTQDHLGIAHANQHYSDSSSTSNYMNVKADASSAYLSETHSIADTTSDCLCSVDEKTDESKTRSVSPRIIKIAANFWATSIDSLAVETQLEIGCSIFFGMLSDNNSIHQVMKNNVKNTQIEAISIKFLDMMGWLIRYLMQNIYQCDETLLIKLGEHHRKMGINLEHYAPMLSSLHDTFAYYFPKAYTVQVKYSIDVIFTMATKIMTQREFNKLTYLDDVANQSSHDLHGCQQLDFLKSFEECLASPMGRQYFYDYLQSVYCHEFVVYLQLINKFHAQNSDVQRFVVARELTKTCILCQANFALNISHECRETTIERMQKLEAKWQANKQLKQSKQEKFHVSPEMFSCVEMEMRRCIIKTHWKMFTDRVRNI